MGVWERSPRGAEIAREHPDLQADYRNALPDFQPEDITGSPYSVHRYLVDPHLGGTEGLNVARAELRRRNLALLLDFVPNHVAVDHPWTSEHPECFVHNDDGTIANGRDPYFPPWTDTAQINIHAAAARSLLTQTLLQIAGQCDGVRCDMAMLLLNEVFQKTWGARAGTPLPDEFWPQAIARVKSQFPDFTFIAEVYWDLEWTMLHQGFDYCYDKRLYDRLLHENAAAIRQHLTAGAAYQCRMVRFLENHDEPRAATVFPVQKHRAAAIAIGTLPGAKLFYEGQFEGRRIKMPVQLGRCPDEQVDTNMLEFYRTLLAACREPLIRNGDWQLLDANGWPDNSSYTNLLAWNRRRGNEGALVAVNYSGTRSQGRIHLSFNGVPRPSCVFRDVLTSEKYVRDADELVSSGLYVDLPAWGVHFLNYCASLVV